MTAVAARNIKFVSHCDLDGRCDGVQIMVQRGYAYLGHGFSNGISTIDVRDPKKPRVVDFIACPPGTRALHLQSHDDIMQPNAETFTRFTTKPGPPHHERNRIWQAPTAV